MTAISEQDLISIGILARKEQPPLARASLVVCMTPEQDKVLLVESKEVGEEGEFCLPGGELADGQTHIQAAQERFTEQTGLTVSSQDLLEPRANLYYKDGFNNKEEIVLQCRLYIARSVSGTLKSNGRKVQWFDMAEVPNEPLIPGSQKYILRQVMKDLARK